MDRGRWPTPREIAGLPANHRRVVAAALSTVREQLEELERRGELVPPAWLLQRLDALERAARTEPPRRHPLSVLAALQVQADELEPYRLAAYGPLSAGQQDTAARLASALRDSLDRLRARLDAGGAARAAFTVRAIGVVHSPCTGHEGTPIQPRYADGITGTIEIFPEYREALADLEGFERIWVLAYLHRSRPWQARVIPYRDTVKRGLFATRAPSRPNPIGLSCLRLLAVHDGTLEVGDLDLLDGTPVLDIKPYSPRFDAYPQARAGWLDRSSHARQAADSRFEEDPPEDVREATGGALRRTPHPGQDDS